MKLIDRAKTLDGKGPTVEVTFEPCSMPTRRERLLLAWQMLTGEIANRPVLRLRIYDEQDHKVIDMTEGHLYLVCMYSGEGRVPDLTPHPRQQGPSDA